MKASEVMTVEVETTRPDAIVREAVQTMLRRGISGLPVGRLDRESLILTMIRS